MLILMLLLAITLSVTVACGNEIITTTAEPGEDSPTDTTTSDDTGNSSVTTQTATQSTAQTTTNAPGTTTTATPPKPTAPEPATGASITVKYVVNNSNAGSITGSASQTIKHNITKTTTVTAIPKLGYKFVKWSDGNTNATRQNDDPWKYTTYTAIFEFDALEIPILDLRTDNGLDITSKEEYVPGKISISNAPEGFNFEDLTMEIRGRGNYTWGSTFNADPMYNKRPYRIKLSEKMNLLGQGNGKSKSWVLMANHCDQSLLRNQTVMNFARTLTGIQWQPSSQNVEVFLNGEYIGV